jgi:hypothetical protein
MSARAEHACASMRIRRAATLVALSTACASCASSLVDLRETQVQDTANWNAGPSADPSTLKSPSDPTMQVTYVHGYPPPPFVQGYPPPGYAQGYPPPPPGYVVLLRPDYGPLAAKPGFYLGASVTGTGMGGDLDGDSALIGPWAVLLPDVDAAVGFNVAAGFRAPADAFELSYDHSNHSGSFQSMPLDSTFNAVNFDWKHYFQIDEKLQPYTLLGMNFPWLDIHDGAFRGSAVGDATLYGIGMNLGGGAAYYLTPQLSVSLQAVCLLIDYFEVSALGSSGTIDSTVFSPGWKLSLGTAFTF